MYTRTLYSACMKSGDEHNRHWKEEFDSSVFLIFSFFNDMKIGLLIILSIKENEFPWVLMMMMMMIVMVVVIAS